MFLRVTNRTAQLCAILLDPICSQNFLPTSPPIRWVWGTWTRGRTVSPPYWTGSCPHTTHYICLRPSGQTQRRLVQTQFLRWVSHLGSSLSLINSLLFLRTGLYPSVASRSLLLVTGVWKSSWEPFYIISRPGRIQGLLYKHLRHWLVHSLIESSFVKILFQCRHVQIVWDGAFSHKIDDICFFYFLLTALL